MDDNGPLTDHDHYIARNFAHTSPARQERMREWLRLNYPDAAPSNPPRKSALSPERSALLIAAVLQRLPPEHFRDGAPGRDARVLEVLCDPGGFYRWLKSRRTLASPTNVEPPPDSET